MVLAFRLYGNFQWPPHPKAGAGKSLRKGLVEIHYREKPEGSGKVWPVLRWLPGEHIVPPGPMPEIKDSLFHMTVDQAVTWFEESQDPDMAIWIDEGTKEKDEDWVSFRGAFLLDQFRPDAVDPDKPDLRWPLVRSCSYVPGKTVFSTLTVGWRDGANFRLNLHLPLPARRSTLLSGKDTDPSAFPFCAVYGTRKGALKKILQPTTLVGGWIEGDAIDTSPANPSLTSFVFAADQWPEDSVLGTFGFSARGEKTGGGFAVYNGKQKDETVNAAKFWPDAPTPFLADLLGRIGFSTGAAPQGWLSLKAGNTTADLSLRFGYGDRSSDPRRPALIYRLGLAVTGSSPDTDGDLKSSSGRLALRLQTETGGWVATAETLHADCSLSFHILDTEIWSDDPKRWSPRVDIDLHWKTTIPDDATAKKGVPKFGTVPKTTDDLDFGLLRHASHSFRTTREALRSVEAGQPQSILPDLKPVPGQTVRFTLSGPSFRAVHGAEPGTLIWGVSKNTPAEGTCLRPRFRLTLAALENLIDNSADTAGIAQGNRLACSAEAQSFFRAADAPVTLRLDLSRDGAWAAGRAEEIADGAPFFASYRLNIVRPANAWSGRLSSLAFAWSPGKDKGAPADPPAELASTFLRAGGPGLRSGMSQDAPAISLEGGRLAASIHVLLPVSNVVPVGVDQARMDRTGRAGPLFIPLDAGDATVAEGYRYWLSIVETISTAQDRRIEADIYEHAADTGEKSYVVLSQEPFSIFRYSHRPLGDRGDIGSASVAYYSGDERIWQYRKVAEHYHYILPPQAVGESMDKPRRLEIHDLGTVDPKDPSDAWRPFVRGTDKLGRDTSDLQRRAVDFRLSPSTEIWIRPSDVERGYFMPEATAHDIFRQRGEYGLGAALAFLRGEFLYGLPVGIDVSGEKTIARQARVAEIEALTGRITGPARDMEADDDLGNRWNALSIAISRRPERLEIWARDPDSPIEFTPARFSHGVRFALRHTAVHRAPLKALEKPEDHENWPTINGSSPDDGNRLDRSRPRVHPQGLSGGALWPVESVNLFNALLERPASSGGTIEAISLSPTGGDAVQKAGFLGGIVTIISETRNGHVERQKVEVLGRIGALWHRAKHVVVYERTVNPSAQFAPTFEENPHRTRSRRPILRKVREYIELLENERAYPDFSAAEKRSTGFLERVRFNSKVIHVDSAWSTEVGTYGWKIPLWNLHSARERPQVYPMPDVAFVTTAEGEGDRPVVSQECGDTDNLFFFADFNAGTSDTNLWNARLDIDYANMPVARTIARSADSKSALPVDGGRRRAVSRLLPGVRRFTWRLAPAAQKTAINAGRAGKPVYVGLDSVTFMRVTHDGQGDAALEEKLDSLLKRVARLPDISVDLPEITALSYWDGKGGGTAIPEAPAFSEAIKNLLSAIDARDIEATEPALAALEDIWKTKTLPAGIRTALEKTAGAIEPLLKGMESLGSSVAKGPAQCERLKADAVGMIRRKQLLVATVLSDWAADADAILTDDSLPPLPWTKDGAIDALCGDIRERLAPIFSEASRDVGNVAESAEKARAIVTGIEAEAEAVVFRARERVHQFASGYDRLKPWSDDRRRAFRSGLEACLGNVANDITAAIDEARQRFAVELSDAGQAIGGQLSKALSAIGRLRGVVPADVSKLEPIVTRLLQPVETLLEKLSPASGVDGELKRLQDEVQAADMPPALKAKARSVLAGLADVVAPLRDNAAVAVQAAADLDTIAATGLGEVRDHVETFASTLSEIARRLAAAASGLLEVADEMAEAGLALAEDFAHLEKDAAHFARSIGDRVDAGLAGIGHAVDPLVCAATTWLELLLADLLIEVRTVHDLVDPLLEDVQAALGVVADVLSPSSLLKTVIIGAVVRPVLKDILKPFETVEVENLDALRAGLQALPQMAGDRIGKLTADVFTGIDYISDACGAVFEGAGKVAGYIDGLATDATAYIGEQVAELEKRYQPLVDGILDAMADLEKFEGEAKALLARVKAFDHSVRGLQNDLSRSMETARMYGDRVFDAVSRLDDGGVMALPSNVLKLYSAVSSAPEIAALKADIDRIRAGFDEFKNVIDTTERAHSSIVWATS